MSRRKFLKAGALGVGGVLLASYTTHTPKEEDPTPEKEKVAEKPITKPIVISTWNHGLAANDAAWEILNSKGNALDAVENGVKITESDATNRSVGLGGLPD